jgi:hypothetical protein
MVLKLGHIINPVTVDDSSDLFVAQPITFETMRIARDFAQDIVEVNLLTAQYPEDRALVPEWFQPTPDLERSILDIGTFRKERKLPLLVDILDHLYTAAPDADYLIYTNVDIGLMPYFYTAVKHMIEMGYDAFVINRRTIAKEHYDVQKLDLMYCELGEKHPGYDCFVFKKSLYPLFKLGTACVGANWIGRVFIVNLICQSDNFNIFDNSHLTFHLGDDRSWQNPGLNDLHKHNEKELHKILLEYQAERLFQDKPLVQRFLQEIEGRQEASSGKRKYRSFLKTLLFNW